jgi:GNAT superfamily N-acetyltransferase
VGAGLRFARESMASVLEEIKPLLAAHWAEIAHYADIALDPNWDWYQGAEAAGQLRIFTARADLLLVGYCIYVVGPGLHYRSHTYANQDILFLAPEHRRGRAGIGLLRFTEGQLRAEGVNVVLHHVKKKLDITPILMRDGYELIDLVMGKRL